MICRYREARLFLSVFLSAFLPPSFFLPFFFKNNMKEFLNYGHNGQLSIRGAVRPSRLEVKG